MALIVRCGSCRAKLPKAAHDSPACPSCGSGDLRYAVDYWPRGRGAGRKLHTFPKGTGIEEARATAQAMTGIKRKPAQAMPAATVESLFPEYLRWYELHRAPTSYTDMQFAFKRLLPILGEIRIDDITEDHFSLYQQTRTPRRNRQVNKELEYFKGLLRYCRREKRMDIPRIEYERLPYKRPLPVVLSPKEVEAFMKAAKAEPLWHGFFACLYYLGFRFSEASHLRPCDFDLKVGIVRVKQKGGTWKILPLCKEVVQPVKRLEKIRGCGPEDFLFVSRSGRGKPVSDSRFAVARICKRAGIRKRVYPHLFRHSAATGLVNSGVGLRTVQDFLGHKDIKNTEIYTHISVDSLRKAQRSLRK